jgi:dUTP pyrophosphatase
MLGIGNRMNAKHLRPTSLPLPSYQSECAAGLDLYFDDPTYHLITIHPGEVTPLSTNVAVAIPEGFEGQVRGRSGLAFKHAVFAYQGTIDSDYRGEIKALLINHGKLPFQVRRGDRIAQLVVSPVAYVPLYEVQDLGSTERGESGFGSTGVNMCLLLNRFGSPCVRAHGHADETHCDAHGHEWGL